MGVKTPNLHIDSANMPCYILITKRLTYLITKGIKKSMTIKELKEIISNLPNDAYILLSTEDTYDLETAIVEYHSDGRIHLVLSNLE